MDPKATGPNQIEQASVLSTTKVAPVNSEAREVFPIDHPLHRLVVPTFRSVREALSTEDIMTVWNTDDIDPSRKTFRPSLDSKQGPGSQLMMAPAACFLTHVKDGAVFLPASIDRTIATYFQKIGFLGERVIYFSSFDEVASNLRERGRRVLCVDDLPERFDDVATNPSRVMKWLNSKDAVSSLSAYAPSELIYDLTSPSSGVRQQIAEWLSHGKVYLKSCNTENAGEGVWRLSSLEEFDSQIADMRSKRMSDAALAPHAIIQREIKGTNKSFQILMDPSNPQQVSVMALSDQLVGGNGVTYAGSVQHDVTAERLQIVGPAILDMVDRIQNLCPGAKGIVMCDYFELPDGSVTLFDPGLRPSGNTVGTMVKLWVDQVVGKPLKIQNRVPLDTLEAGIPALEVLRRLGEWAEPETIVTKHFGVFLQGHNHLQGKTRLVVVAPSEGDLQSFTQELKERVARP